MNYYIEKNKKGPAIKCSKTKYYKVKREVLTASKEPICLYEYKGIYYRHLVIL